MHCIVWGKECTKTSTNNVDFASQVWQASGPLTNCFTVQVPEDLEAMKVPALFLCAERDSQFPEQKRTAAMQASQRTAPGGCRAFAEWLIGMQAGASLTMLWLSH